MDKKTKIKALIAGLLLSGLAIFAILLSGCAKNPAGPEPAATPVATAATNNLRLLGRGFPITVTNPNQNTTVLFSYIHADCGTTGEMTQTTAYAKVDGMADMGYMQLPATFPEADGSITHIGFAIDEGKVMFHTWNTMGKTPRSFQAWIVTCKL